MITITNWIEGEGFDSISASTSAGEYLWLRIGGVTFTISAEQAQYLSAELNEAVTEWKNARTNTRVGEMYGDND